MLGKLPVPGRPTILITVGQGSIALAVGAGGGCLDIFTLIYLLPSPSPSLWETARYRLKYCFKGPLNPNNQPTNQHFLIRPKSELSETAQSLQHSTHPLDPLISALPDLLGPYLYSTGDCKRKTF